MFDNQLGNVPLMAVPDAENCFNAVSADMVAGREPVIALASNLIVLEDAE